MNNIRELLKKAKVKKENVQNVPKKVQLGWFVYVVKSQHFT